MSGWFGLVEFEGFEGGGVEGATMRSVALASCSMVSSLTAVWCAVGRSRLTCAVSVFLRCVAAGWVLIGPYSVFP